MPTLRSTDSSAHTRSVREGLLELASLATQVADAADDIDAVIALYCATLRRGGKLYFIGNGGSAADAQHIATEYVVRFSANRRAFAAVALTTDTSLITATGNDLSFEEIFSRQVEALCGSDDLLVIHSTSGESENLMRAASAARSRRTQVVAFLGKGGGRLRSAVDLAIVVPSSSTSHIQELHLALEHLICAAVEAELLK